MNNFMRYLYSFILAAAVSLTAFPIHAQSSQPNSTADISIPAELGTVTTHGSPDAPLTVIHIQDAHCYYPVQKQIANIISYLNQSYDISAIFVEGAASSLNANRIATFPDKSIRTKTADYFLKEGKISGVEYLLISNGNTLGAAGVEDSETYRANYTAFSESRGISSAIDSITTQLDSFLIRLKSDTYSDQLLALDRHERAFRDGQEPLRAYVQYLNQTASHTGTGIHHYKNISALLALLQKEKTLDYRTIELEKNVLISRLQEKLTADQKIILLDATLNFSLQKITSLSLFQLLKEFSETSEIGIDEFAQLNRYISYLEASESISFADTYTELEQATEQIQAGLTSSDAERQIQRLDLFVRRLHTVAALQASRAELENYHNDREWFIANIPDYIQHYPQFAPDVEHLEQLFEQMESIERFYTHAFQRDTILANNTLQAMQTDSLTQAVLITGGFHADGIAKLLEDRSIRVISVRPAFLSYTDTTKQMYESVILGYKNPLENYLLIHGQTLAAALALVDGSPLVQEWKGAVYQRELEVMALVAKLSVIRAETERELGITAAQKLTDAIATQIASLIQSSADSFLTEWNAAYQEQTGTPHPFTSSVDVSISFDDNTFFAAIEINGQPIHFPLNSSFAVNPGAIVNAYLTPQRYTALLAGDTAIRETITSVDELKEFRQRLQEFFLSPHTLSDQVQQRDRELLRSIVQSLAATAPEPVKNALSDIDRNQDYQTISDTINQALFDARLDDIIRTLTEKTAYSELYDLVQYGATTPLRVLHTTLLEDAPDIALFAGYLIDNFTAFNDTVEPNDILLVLNGLHDQYIASSARGDGTPLDARMLMRIAKIIHSSLAYGDGIRPHRVVGILVYGFGPREDVPFMRYWQMHNLLEQLSLYDENEVIRLLFYTRWANPSMMRPLIALNLPYSDLLNVLDSPELRAIRRNPSPRTFAEFKQATSDLLTPQAQLGILAGALPQYDVLRTALTALTTTAFTESGVPDNRFMHSVLRVKRRARFSPAVSAQYDLIIMHVLNRIPDELLQPQAAYDYIGVYDFEELDRNSTRFSDQSVAYLNQASATQRGQRATIISAHPGYPANSDSIVTDLEIDVTRHRYQQALEQFLEEQERPTLLLVDHTQYEETLRWLNDLNLNSMVILVRYDPAANDLVIDAKKDLSWLDYWPNLTSSLARNFRNARLNVTALDKRAYKRLDSIGREEISLDNFFSRYGTPTYDETMLLATTGGADILSNLIHNGGLDKDIIHNMTQNQHFTVDHINAILHHPSLTVTDQFYEDTARLVHSSDPAVQPKFGRADYKSIFAGIQNNRTGRLLAKLAEQPDAAQSIFNVIDNPDQLAALVVHGYRNGFRITAGSVAGSLSLRMKKWDTFAHRLMALAPEAAADFVTAVSAQDISDAQQFIESLGANQEAQPAIASFLTILLSSLAIENPEFQDLIPFVQSDITPPWHKAFVINQLLQPGTEPAYRSQYIYSILNIFSSQSEFTEWIHSNSEKHQDRVDEWIRVVSLLPEIEELRSEFMLTAAIMTDMHIVIQYREFLGLVTNPQGAYTALRENPEEFRLLFQALNADFALPIESKMFVFNILPFIKFFLPEGQTVSDIFDAYVEKVDEQGTVTVPGIPVYAILPVIIFAEGNRQILDDFKAFFSVPQISVQRSVKVQLASYFLRVFTHIDHAKLHQMFSPSAEQDDIFQEALLLSTSTARRNEIMQTFSVKAKDSERISERFEAASRHRDIILKTILYAGKDGFNRRNQRALIESINFMSILNDNFAMLNTGENTLGEQFSSLLDTADQFDLAVQLQQTVMTLFIAFIQLDFPDVFESEADIIEKLPRVEQITNFWIYKADWETENPRGLQMLRDAVRAYLKDGSSLKWLKYGGTPESTQQLQLYQAVLTEMWTEHYQQREGLTQRQAQQQAAFRAAQFVAAWKRDTSEQVDFKQYPALNSDASVISWTSDEVPHWLNFGLAGGCTCFAPGNVVSYTKNLPGFIFSGLVAGGLYLGKYQGDIREQVDHAVLPIMEGGKPRMYLVNQYYYSSGGQVADTFGTASVIASIRNAALYGTDGVVIPSGSPQSAYFKSHADFFLKDFSTVVEHRDTTGKIIARERITLESAESVHSLSLTVPREPNQWRYFDEASMYKGQYYEKMNRNFSFVDFSGSVPKEVAGVAFEGLNVEVDSVVIKIRRQQLPLESQADTAEPAQLSDTLEQLVTDNQLTILQTENPQIEQLIDRIAQTDTTTGENLNIMLQASQIMAEHIRENLFSAMDMQDKKFLLLTFTRTGVPIARKIGEMMEGNIIDFSLSYISSSNELRNFPAVVARPIFIVDEAIVTGTTSARNIDIVIEKGLTPDQIIIVTLTADPRALERLSRKYPGIQFIVGTLEERAQQQGEYVSIALNNLMQKTQPLTLTRQERVKVGGVEYRILDRIQRGKSFVVFHAETEDGRKVLLKTTVSANEGERFRNISALTTESNLTTLGIPQFHHYDAQTGILITDFIDGPALGDYLRNTDTDTINLSIDLLYALRDMMNVAQFLSLNDSLFVNLSLNNIRFNTAAGKWYLTNYSPFPYRLQPLEQEGVLQQIQYILQESIRIMQTSGRLIFEHEQQGIHTLQSISDNIQSGKISTIQQLQTRLFADRVALFYPQKASAPLALLPDQADRLNALLKGEQGNLISERLFALISSQNYPVTAIRGLVSFAMQNTTLSDAELRSYLLLGLETDLKQLITAVPSSSRPHFAYLADDDSLIQQLSNTSALADADTTRLLQQTDALRQRLSEQAESLAKTARSGKPVLLGGNSELVRWVASELYIRLGESFHSMILIVPATADYSHLTGTPSTFRSQALTPLTDYTFTRTIRQGKANIIGTEATLLDWSQIAENRSLDSAQADIIRRRIVKNPRLNFTVKNLRGSLLGMLSFTRRNAIDTQFLQDIPESADGGRHLVLYSSFLDAPRLKERYHSANKELISAIIEYTQYPLLYRVFQSSEFFTFTVQEQYLPFLNSQVELADMLAAIRTNEPVQLIDLFPGHEPSMENTLSAALDTVWQQHGEQLREILDSLGDKAFFMAFIRHTLSTLTALNPQMTLSEIIRDTLGISLSPYEFLTYSLKRRDGQLDDIDRLYSEYTTYMEQIPPDIQPLPRSAFLKIILAEEGNSAFQQWIAHHNPDLHTQFQQFTAGQTDSLSDAAAEQTGAALQTFLLFTGRELLDPSIKDGILREGTAPVISIADILPDPLSSADILNSVQTGFVASVQYRTQSEQLHWFDWLNLDIQANLRDFLIRIPDSGRKQIEQTLLQVDYLTYIPQIERALTAIFDSPLSDQSIITLIRSGLDKLGTVIESTNPDGTVIVVDASQETIPSIQASNQYILFGDYPQVRQMYTNLITALPLDQMDNRDQFVHNITGYTPLITHLPTGLPEEFRNPLVQFAQIDQTRVHQTHAATLILTDQQPLAFRDSEVTEAIINRMLINQLGQGGVIVQLAVAASEKIESLSRLIVRYEYTAPDGNIYIRVSLRFGDTEYDFPARLEIVKQQDTPSAQTTLPQQDIELIGFDQAIQPVARRLEPISSTHTMKTTFFEPVQSDAAFTGIASDQLSETTDVSLRRKVAAITQLWYTNKYMPLHLDGTFMSTPTPAGEELSVVFDSTAFQRIPSQENFLLTLALQGIPVFTVAPADQENWKNGETISITPNIPVIDGILDGLNGNTTLLNNLLERLETSTTQSSLIHTVTQHALTLMRPHLAQNEITELQRILFQIARRTPAEMRHFDFSPLQQLPFFEGLNDQLTQLEQYANRLRRSLLDSQTALNAYNQKSAEKYLIGPVRDRIAQFESYLATNQTTEPLERFVVSQDLVNSLQSNKSLSPKQLIEARILLSLSDVQPLIRAAQVTVENANRNESLFITLNKILELLRTAPENLPNQLDDLIEQSGYTQEAFLGLILPGFDMDARTFEIHGQRIRLGSLSALLRTERILATRPLLIAGDSSSLHFEVLEQIQSLFNLPVISYDALAVLPQEKQQMGLDAPRDSQRMLTYREYMLTRWTNEQAGSYFIDLAQPLHTEFIALRREGTVFDLRSIENTESFLDEFVLHFESAYTDRLTFYLDDTLFAPLLNELDDTAREELTDFLRAVVQTRIELYKAVRGEENDVQSFLTFAQSTGLSTPPEQMIARARLMDSGSEIVALIIESLRGSDTYPSFADVYNRMIQTGGITDSRLIMLLDVYSRLAQEYFARHIEQLAVTGDVAIDTDLGIIEHAGREISLSDEHFSFMLQLLRSARIGYKVFAQGTTAETVITFSQQLSGTGTTFADAIAGRAAEFPDLIPELNQRSNRLEIRLQRQQVIEQSL